MATKKTPPKPKTAPKAPSPSPKDPFGARDSFDTGSGKAAYYRLDKIDRKGITPLAKLPYSIRVLLEAALRSCDGFEVTEEDVVRLASWKAKDPAREEIPFKPSRVVLQDFTGVPVVVDLAAMRDAVQRLGGDPARINPKIPVDLVIDHSVQVDAYGSPTALDQNADLEFSRNKERYEFLRWGQTAFERFRVVPPATGIVHQVNLEYLANVVQLVDGVALPDSVVGTDSHTTMINGIGVLGWGVGGIEAEAAMLGQAMTMVIPDVIGFKLSGELPEGATATDLVLTVTEMLRKKGVVEKFVEFFGPGVDKLSLADRATVANMAPEYGATIGFFPVDDETLAYMKATGRPADRVALVEKYCKANHLFRTKGSPEPEFTDVLELDLAKVVPSLAGPRRPQDRVNLKDVKAGFRKELGTNYKKDPAAPFPQVSVRTRGTESVMSHGSVVIAAITSCTNTSNPSVMVGAGLVAKKAHEKGLRPKAHVKTSLAPGSRVVTRYLEKAGLIPSLEAMGFHVVGYGCTTCIGNSGPIPDEVGKAIKDKDLVAAAVLSGNRNFEGRVHPLTRANYLASPPLVVAYALAGTVDIDFDKEPIGDSKDGEPVYLRDIWPTLKEVQKAMTAALDPKLYQGEYKDVFKGSAAWNKIKIPTGKLYAWSKTSTYVAEPPYFDGLTAKVPAMQPIAGARVLASFADSVTTDHISPAGDIPEAGPAGAYLKANGVTKVDFNSFGARRGNHQVMMRGTFANIRIKNKLVPGVEGGVTAYLGASDTTGPTMSIYEAAMKYQAAGVPLIVLAGKEYGTGSSRDWAAKGTILLGVRAVIAESFERIHRSNLIGMGVLPLQFKAGESADKLGLTGTETFEILGVDEKIAPRSTLKVKAGGKTFEVLCRIDTPVEVKYLKNRGILHAVLRDMIGKA